MQVTINVPDTTTVSVRGIDVVIDYTKAKDAAAMAQRLWAYGHRKFNDASPMGLKAPVGDEKAMEAFKASCADNARTMVAAWLNGDFEAERGGGGRESDPIGKRARAIAVQLVEAKLGKLAKDASDDDKAARAKKVAEVAANDKVRAKAKAQLDEEAAFADLV